MATYVIRNELHELEREGKLYDMSLTEIVEDVLDNSGLNFEYIIDTYDTDEESKRVFNIVKNEIGRYLLER